MSCICPKGSKRAFADGSPSLVIAFFFFALSGCSHPATLHPEYSRLKPLRIAVLPVRNETVYPLDEVAFGGALARMTTGPRVYNIPERLRGAFVETLGECGYTAFAYDEGGSAEARLDFSRPLEAESPPLPFDAALLPTIRSWQASTAALWKVSMTCRVDVHRVPTGELLYSCEYSHAGESDSRNKGAPDVPTFVKGCARRCLASLPRTGE